MCRDINAVVFIDDSVDYTREVAAKRDVPTVVLFGEYAWNTAGCVSTVEGCADIANAHTSALHPPLTLVSSTSDSPDSSCAAAAPAVQVPLPCGLAGAAGSATDPALPPGVIRAPSWKHVAELLARLRPESSSAPS
jgi:hypothetical protein